MRRALNTARSVAFLLSPCRSAEMHHIGRQSAGLLRKHQRLTRDLQRAASLLEEHAQRGGTSVTARALALARRSP